MLMLKNCRWHCIVGRGAKMGKNSNKKMCIRVVACSKQMNASLLGYTIWVNSATLLNCTFYLVLAQYSSNYIAMSNISSTPLPILPLHRRSDWHTWEQMRCSLVQRKFNIMPRMQTSTSLYYYYTYFCLLLLLTR